MKRRTDMKERDDAVSPVIGVMLMLVVTIIIAAVVSLFAGGLVGDAKEAPAMTADVSIKNTGYYATSQFLISVISVSDPIPTADLKIITSWKTTDKTDEGRPTITGGATVTPGKSNVYGWTKGRMLNPAIAPWGYGYGVESVNTGTPNRDAQQFGNYTIQGGTLMKAMPVGTDGGFGGGISNEGGYGIGVDNDGNPKPFYYDSNWVYDKGTKVDGMQAVLGKNWESLRTGDIVHVQIVYTPSGQTILEKDVAVVS
jgi:FlaG/FlaF family flagellin (archaellin)